MIGLARGIVKLAPYQMEWPSLFEQEADLLYSVLGESALHIEHIGSTSIYGMSAKPIIDMMVAVASLIEARSFVPKVESLGYEFRPDDEVADRLFFAKGPHSNRTHHLSLAEPTSEFYREKILFREYLRAHGEVAEEYRKLKEELAEKYSQNRASYTEGKREFVEEVLRLAKGAD